MLPFKSVYVKLHSNVTPWLIVISFLNYYIVLLVDAEISPSDKCLLQTLCTIVKIIIEVVNEVIV